MTSLYSTLQPRELTEARGSLTPAVGSAKPSADHRAGRVPAHPPSFPHTEQGGERGADRPRGKEAGQGLSKPGGPQAGSHHPPPPPGAPRRCPTAPREAPSPGLRFPTCGSLRARTPPLPPCRPTLRTQSGNSRPMCRSPSTSGAGSFILSCSEPQRCFTQQAQRLPFNRNLRPTPSRTQNRSASRRKPST